jgi:hypothetical protein
MVIQRESPEFLPIRRRMAVVSPVIIFSQQGNKTVISFSYASVQFDPLWRQGLAKRGSRCARQSTFSSIFSSIDMNNKSMQSPFFRLIL